MNLIKVQSRKEFLSSQRDKSQRKDRKLIKYDNCLLLLMLLFFFQCYVSISYMLSALLKYLILQPAP